jgi:hypothetical protein
LKHPDGATEVFTPTVAGSTATFTQISGAPYVISGVPSTTTGVWTSLTLTMKDLSKWTFAPTATAGNYFLTNIANVAGRAITINRNTNYSVASVVNDAATMAT